MTEKRIFPIKVEPACLLKWNWSTIFFNSGTSASCHRTERYPIDPNNFDAFHNLPEKLRDRNEMLQGRWPGHGCDYCKNVETNGGYSDRQMQLDAQRDPGLTPPELHLETTTEITPTIIEVWFKNTCNMKCVYCGPHFSSLWEEENRKFKQSFLDKKENKFSVRAAQDNPDYDSMVNGLWHYLADRDRYKVLRRYHILGGEPFLLSELDDSIDFWDNHPNPDLIFSIITNMNIPHRRFKSYIDRFKNLVQENKLWKLQLTASLDSWGPQQSYTRFGLNLDQWRENFEYLIGKPWISLSINSAISALIIKEMPVLIDLINQWNTKQKHSDPIIHSFNTVMGFDDPYIFEGETYQKDFEKIMLLMPEDTEIQQNQKRAMKGIADTSLKSVRNSVKIKKLQNYLDTLDQRRHTDWRLTFPWLDKDFT